MTRSPRNRFRQATTGLAVAFVSASAEGQSTPSQVGPPRVIQQAEEPPAITPPRLIASPVEYPLAGRGSKKVVLILVVNADGTVRSATSSVAEEPFSSAAEAAAAGWRLEPARRGSTPVAATIRVEVSFEPPAAAPDVPTTTPGTQSLGEEPPASAAVEVTIKGERTRSLSLSSTEVRQLPGAFGDPFRAIEALPGVTPVATGIPYFYVRGAPPGNVGYFLDGIRVPLLFHLALGPSVIHPALVDRVDLFSGGYPAAYGRFMGAIVTADTTPRAVTSRGEASLRLFDAGALAETPFAGDKATALVAGRYSYASAILSLFTKDVEIGYWDYQSRVTYDTGPNERVTVFGFGSHDAISERVDGRMQPAFVTDFHRADVRFDRKLEAGAMRTGLTLGFDRTLVGKDGTMLRDRMVSARSEFALRLGSRALVRVGSDLTLDTYELDGDQIIENAQTVADLRSKLAPGPQLAGGSWTDIELSLTDQLTLTPGARIDFVTSGGITAPSIDPRVNFRARLTDQVRTTLAFGMVHQPPSFVLPVPGVQLSGLRDGLQESIQSSAGIEADILTSTASVTVFRNAFFNMTDPAQTVRGLDSALSAFGPLGGSYLSILGDRMRGSSLGLEVLVRRRLTQRLGGFVAYTLARSTVTTGTFTAPSVFDRTHVLNAVVGYDLGRNWRAGTRFVFYSGIPPDPSRLRGISYFDDGGRGSSAEYHYDRRTPAFYRIDCRLEKRWHLGTSASIAAVFEVMNALMAKEAKGLTCSASGCVADEIGPIVLPSVGVEANL